MDVATNRNATCLRMLLCFRDLVFSITTSLIFRCGRNGKFKVKPSETQPGRMPAVDMESREWHRRVLQPSHLHDVLLELGELPAPASRLNRLHCLHFKAPTQVPTPTQAGNPGALDGPQTWTTLRSVSLCVRVF